MSLRINHNIASMNAFRNLTKVEHGLNKNLERLSSGLRINSAADDPAGLSISQQFRAQISGLGQAIENAETSINMLLTAEGALAEVHNLLTTMRELAVHASNEGVNDATMLAADQDQLESAIDTITRIAQETQFGAQYLLDGSSDNGIGISTNASDIELAQNSTLSEGFHTVTVSSVVDASQFIDNESLGLSDPTSVVGLDAGDHQVVVTQESAGAIVSGDDIDFTSTLTITAGVNDDFMLSLDGGSAMTVTVAAGGHTNATTLAAAIETAVNMGLTTASLSAAEIDVTATGDQLVFTTGDQGSAASISIHDTGLTTSSLADINVTQQVTVGTDAIVTLDNQVNYIYDVDERQDGSATLQDKDGNTVDFTVGNASAGLTLGSTTLTFNAKSFLVDLDGDVQGRFEVGKTGTISNGRESVDLRFGSNVAAGINKIRAEDNSLRFQIGANEGQFKEISIASMAGTQLGLT
ncbi:MAG: hypothetical protein CME06_03240, partial [Gemmatimonadetes bacterium]|nr:hypothetical protein [Gemmatimonadota bacterium]